MSMVTGNCGVCKNPLVERDKRAKYEGLCISGLCQCQYEARHHPEIIDKIRADNRNRDDYRRETERLKKENSYGQLYDQRRGGDF